MKYSNGEIALMGLAVTGLINCVFLLHFAYFKLKTLEDVLRPLGIKLHYLLDGGDPISRLNRLSALFSILSMPTAEKKEGRISRAELRKLPLPLIRWVKILYASVTINGLMLIVHWIIYRDTIYAD